MWMDLQKFASCSARRFERFEDEEELEAVTDDDENSDEV
jgi:hypothetical protein